MAKATCKVDDCDQPSKTKGFCGKHYMRWSRHGAPDVVLKPVYKLDVCQAEGCDTLRQGPGLCKRCYRAMRRRKKLGPKCSVAGCANVRNARGLCVKHYRAERRASGEAAYVYARTQKQVQCAYCGAALERANASERSFCDMQCCGKYHAKTPASDIYYKTCEYCKREYVSRYEQRPTCSDECRDARTRQRANQQYVRRPPREIVCEVCAKVFVVQGRGGGQRRYCSSECYHDSDSYKQQQANHNANRRARMVANEYERIDKRTVYDRDNWTCQVCGKRVNEKVRFPHPKSPSLDHIVALALGGSHTYRNVQLTHLGCNVDKGTQGPGQLRLLA